MALQSRIESDVYVAGNLSANEVTLPDGTVDNEAVAGAASIDASKLQHQHIAVGLMTSTSATNDSYVHSVYGATGEVIAIKASQAVKCVGDASVTANVIKYNGTNATVAISTAGIILNSSSTNYVVQSATVKSDGSEDLVAGDILKILFTPSAGTAGTVATAVFASVIIREEAN